MQITIKDSDALNGEATIRTSTIDVSEIPLLTVALIVHTIGGGSASISVQLETSENLEDWDDVGSPISQGSAIPTKAAFKAGTDVWGRYLRTTITFTGTTPKIVYSLYMNTFPSS